MSSHTCRKYSDKNRSQRKSTEYINLQRQQS